MKENKKWELIAKAHQEYPKGTKFTSPVTGDYTFDYVSTGLFTCWKDHYNHSANKNSIWRVNKNGQPEGIVYDGSSNNWAEIITDKPKSILSGKCAIQVNNEREFKLLMEHYAETGKQSRMGINPLSMDYYNFCDKDRMLISYSHEFCLPHKFKETISCDLDIEYVWSYINPESYTIISFADFASEVNIKVPKFILRSEDGVDLYFGDTFWCANKCGEWVLNTSLSFNGCAFTFNSANFKTHLVILNPENAKAFSTKEAAEKWISEMNKPKEIELVIRNARNLITKEGVRIRLGSLSGEELESIYKAYQSLQEEVSCK